MELSQFLARVMGIYLMITCVAVLVNPREIKRAAEEALQSFGLLFLSAVFTLILGVLLIVGHNVWELSGAVVVTIAGWITFLKGCWLLYFPEPYRSFARRQIRSNGYLTYTVISLLAGIYLLYYGFFFYR